MKSSDRMLIVWCRCGNRMQREGAAWHCPGKAGWKIWHFPINYHDSYEEYIPFPGVRPSIRRFVRRPIGLAMVDAIWVGAILVLAGFFTHKIFQFNRLGWAEYVASGVSTVGCFFGLKWHIYSRWRREYLRPKVVSSREP